MTARAAVSRVGRRFFPLLMLGLIITVAEGAGLVACAVGGVWLWGIWAVAAPVFVLEDSDIGLALGRSRALVHRSFWRVWGIRALGWVLTSVLAQLIVVPFEALGLLLAGDDVLDVASDSSGAAVYVFLAAAGQLITATLVGPISAAIDLLLYTDLRMRKEGMDLVLTLPPEPGIGAAGPAPAVSAW